MYNQRIQDMTRPLSFQAMTSTGRAPPGQTCIPQWGCRWNPWLPLQRPGQELHPPATRPEGSHRISDHLMEWQSVFLEHMQHMDIWWWYMDMSTKKKHLNHQICWSTSRCCILSHKPICWIDWYTTLYYPIEGGQPYLVFQLPASHCIRFHSLHVQLMWARHVGLEGHAMVNTDDLIPGWW